MLTRPISPDLRRRYVEGGLWAGRAVYELFDTTAARVPHKLAVADPRHRLSYRELADLTRGVASMLLDLGVRPGDAVAVQAPNSVFLPIVHLATSRVQGVFVPMHESWREREVHHLLATSGARVLFAVDTYDGFDHLGMVAALRADLPALEHVVPLTVGPGGLDGLPRATVDKDERLSLVVADPTAVRYTMISSGTTALPKISGWTDDGLHAMLLHNYARTSGLVEDDVALGIAPASTGATGYVFPVLAPLLVGASAVLHDPWQPDEALRLIDAERASYAVAIPTQIIKMLESPVLRSCSFASLTRLSNGGAPLPESRAREAERVFACRVHTMYGTTDAGVPTMMDIRDPEEKRVTAVGRCVDGAELRVVSPDGEVLPAGEPGEVVWQSADKVHGYLNNDEATRATFDPDGWYHSGDLGVLDAEGYLRIVGRQKDMILRGGQNIFPGEMEEILAAHPKVVSVAVVAMPDEVLGERACAFVVPTDPSDPLTFDEMIECLRAADVARYKRPERLEVVDDFPLSAGGKIQKDALTARITATLRAGD